MKEDRTCFIKTKGLSSKMGFQLKVAGIDVILEFLEKAEAAGAEKRVLADAASGISLFLMGIRDCIKAPDTNMREIHEMITKTNKELESTAKELFGWEETD